jgi:tRNA (adenine57-N1/adenine58-N1)-methyltransferase
MNTNRGPLQDGEQVLLIDRKGREYVVFLKLEDSFHSHMGRLLHREIIGQQEGALLRTSLGNKLLVFRPTLADTVRHLPRVSQVIYPKDIGLILVTADIFPGARVVEAGLGSGALTASLLRAVGPTGSVISYEVRADIVEKAKMNVRSMIGPIDSLTVKPLDVYEYGIEEKSVDRVVLDLPEPWRVVASAAEALNPGGIFLGFLPTILQVHRLVMALQEDGRFQLVRAVELIERPWHVTARSVRPVHRMVAHTGFIITGRRSAATISTVNDAGQTLEVTEISMTRMSTGEAADLDDINIVED